MLGKTHMMVGIAATIAVTRPETLSELIMAAGIGSAGAVISDLDVGTSDFHREADKIILLTVAAVAGVFALDHFCNTGIWERILNNGGLSKVLTGVLLFMGTCAYGKEQPHRSFMHSFLGMAILCMALQIISPTIVPYFAVGFISHLALDLLNKKGVRLFYPLKGGIHIGACKSKGLVNHLFFMCGMVISGIEILVILYQIFF